MGIFSKIGTWFKSLFNKLGAVIEKMWTLAKPFLQEAVSKTALEVWKSCQNLFVEAALHVSEKGLPTEKAKQDEFRSYMTLKAKDEISRLRDREFNIFREMAVAIAEKISGQ